MDFKRLNNMTGKDPVLNRRITSIFINEFESFRKYFANLPLTAELDHFQFVLHKTRPSLVIFELDSLIKKYEEYLDIRKTGGTINETAEGRKFWSLIDAKGARKSWKYNFLPSFPKNK